MAGLVPAIHVFQLATQDVDAHDISAFTRGFDALCAGMTSAQLGAPATPCPSINPDVSGLRPE
jgi:hypothetical protein